MVSTLCLAVEVKQKKDSRLFARNMETNGSVDVWADASLSRFLDRFADFEQMERAPMSVDLPGPFESERRP